MAKQGNEEKALGTCCLVTCGVVLFVMCFAPGAVAAALGWGAEHPDSVWLLIFVGLVALVGVGIVAYTLLGRRK